MTISRLLAFSLLGASALLACGASSIKTTSGTGGAGTTGTVTGSGGSGTGGKSTAGSGGGGVGGSGGGLIIHADGGGTGDASSACSHLNIGIFGNAGADASSNFQTWLEMSGTTVQRLQTATTANVPITAALLQPFDVIVLDWLTRDYAASEVAAFAAFVTAGGGVAAMSGYSSSSVNDWHANSLLAPLQVAYTGPPISGPITSFATHPITAGLTSVTFNGGFAIADLGGTASTRTPIAFLNPGGGNVNVAYAIQMGAGRAFMWGDEWIEFDSEWSTIPQIKQLWVQVFSWISPTNKCALMPPT